MEKILDYYFDDGSHVKFDKYTIDESGVIRNNLSIITLALCSVVTEIPHMGARGRRYSITYTRFVDTSVLILTQLLI